MSTSVSGIMGKKCSGFYLTIQYTILISIEQLWHCAHVISEFADASSSIGSYIPDCKKMPTLALGFAGCFITWYQCFRLGFHICNSFLDIYHRVIFHCPTDQTLYAKLEFRFNTYITVMACDPLMLVVSPLVSYIYPANISFVFFLVYQDYPKL